MFEFIQYLVLHKIYNMLIFNDNFQVGRILQNLKFNYLSIFMKLNLINYKHMSTYSLIRYTYFVSVVFKLTKNSHI